MAKGYWIAHVDVSDPETYAGYVANNPAIFAKFGGRFIVRGGRFDTVEGTSRQRNVVMLWDKHPQDSDLALVTGCLK